MAPRRYRVDEVAPVLVETWAVLRTWLETVPRDDFGGPSTLPGWTIGDLIAHLGLGLGALIHADPVAAADSGSAMTVEEWTRIYPKVAAGIDRATRDRSTQTADDLLGGLDAQWTLAVAALDTHGAGDSLVQVRVQRIQWSDLIVTRLVELVVHADDLARSVTAVPAPAIPTAAHRIVVRTLLEVLAARSPGNSVEVRVPPFAAVQCIEGPRHTRGTPPNTVETDPTTWLRLACGRIAWGQALAQHAINASGARADLSGLLPLL
jgi:uncharacterized protein (TIGR03083 family)